MSDYKIISKKKKEDYFEEVVLTNSQDFINPILQISIPFEEKSYGYRLWDIELYEMSSCMNDRYNTGTIKFQINDLDSVIELLQKAKLWIEEQRDNQ